MTKHKGLSIRLKMMLAFLLILGVSYYAVATSLVGLVGDSLYTEHRKQDMSAVRRLSQICAPLFAQTDFQQLQQVLSSNASEMEARILLTDTAGKIHYDSLELLNGHRSSAPEVSQILNGKVEIAYGIHSENGGKSILIFPFADHSSLGGYSSVCSGLISEDGSRLGTLTIISSVGEMVERIAALQQKVALVFLMAAAAATVFTFFFSGIITKPIRALIKSTQRMAHGDLTTRVDPKGGGELRQLSEAYNSMCEKLEALDKSRNQFVSNASHELKTPLATMKILLESIIYQPDMEEGIRTEFLSDINKEIDRLSMIIGDLLNLVSMDSKTMRLEISNCSLSQLIKDNAHRLQTLMQQRKQELILQLSDRCDIQADSGKLSQVIYNLLENASKYTQEGGCIRVRLVRSGPSAILSVTDNGPGIPKEDQAHIFERFYRVDKARSRETGGTGLGLSIVNQMVLMHGGTVSVQSEVGKGSTFTVELPVTSDKR